MCRKKRAWLYCRIDAPEDEHGRLKGQLKELTDYAEQMEFEIAGVSQEISCGEHFDRNGLTKVTEAVATGKIDVLLIVNISRIGRDAGKTVDYIHLLNRQGIRIYSPLKGEITSGILR
jgi:DNA invertase Pin-like site-specific DNA recombinase